MKIKNQSNKNQYALHCKKKKKTRVKSVIQNYKNFKTAR